MNPDRRTFIRTLGAGSIAGLAGCSALSGGDDTDTPATDAEPTDAEKTSTPEPTGTETDAPTDTDAPATGDGPTVITMKAAGADIWESTDLGHFFFAEVSGDFDARVEVTSLENTNPHAKAGLMARAALDPKSRNVMVRKRAGFGTSPQWRPTDGAATTSTTSEAGAPLSRVEGGTMNDANWQRLQRVGDTIRAYGSQNGEDWTLMVELTADQIELPDTVFLGLAATSHDNASATTAKFRNLSGVEPTKNQDLGSPIISGSVSVDQAAVISGLGAESSPTGATLTGTLESMGGSDTVDARFEYREATASEWQATDATSLSEPGAVEVDVSGLTPRRYYEFRAVAATGDQEFATVAQLFSTPSGSDGSSDQGPASSSHVDPSQGFADMAPWLDDDTPLVVVDEPTRESLAAATSIPGPRVVVFETSGTIDLGAQDLNVRNDKCWIAGQTAPSPGITLIRGALKIYGNDCVVQHIRSRPGTAGMERGDGWQPDAIEAVDETTGNVIDHCTGTWSVDENINIGYDTSDNTITNCLMAEPLNDATHGKGEHGYNSIIGDRAKNVTLAGNVYGLATDRNPRLKQGTETVVVNNLIHHYHDGMWADPETKHSIVGNVFEDPQTDQPNIFGDGSVYAEDNVQNDDADVPMIGDGISQLDSRPLWPEALEAVSSGEVKSHNLEHAGARPTDRTETDKRIISHIRNGEGGVIDSQEEVGGYPELAENTHSLDVPTTGLRAWLREQAAAVEP
ncbi:pectate lyase [Halosimplex aquaticum]|uniref:Pectate lyase n=1 Tax=Halosimplex aquaticum TaxID=3026162 RepID=A0ABD5Y8R3_9EURY|nr:pectate lyase [Halosimplex aquaticum]